METRLDSTWSRHGSHKLFMMSNEWNFWWMNFVNISLIHTTISGNRIRCWTGFMWSLLCIKDSFRFNSLDWTVYHNNFMSEDWGETNICLWVYTTFMLRAASISVDNMNSRVLFSALKNVSNTDLMVFGFVTFTLRIEGFQWYRILDYWNVLQRGVFLTWNWV